MNKPPFFIVSSGRAGTTLLRIILNSHPEVLIPKETDFPNRAWGKIKDHNFTDSDFYILARMFQLTSVNNGWDFSLNQIVNIFKASNSTDLSQCINALLKATADRDKPGAKYFGIKRPNLIFHIERIWSLFPEARVIHVIRDGRDVSLSYKKANKSGIHFGPRSLISSALYWRTGVACSRRFSDDSRLLTIPYEDLLVEFMPTMEKISRFLNISHLPEIYLNYDKSQRPKDEISSVARSSIHANLLKGIMTTNFNKHLNEMSFWHALLFESLAGDVLKEHGYKLRYPITLPLSYLVRVSIDNLLIKINNIRYERRESRMVLMATQSMQHQDQNIKI